MNPEILPVRCERLVDELLPILRGLVFHVTRPSSYQGIVKKGTILNNKDKRFKYTFPQSANSWGRNRGYVSLFDLCNISDEHLFGCADRGISGALDKFYFLNPPPCGNNPIFLVLDEAFHADLIPWTEGKGEMRIPYVEAWYPGDIKLTKVRKVFDVRVIRPTPTGPTGFDLDKALDQIAKRFRPRQ